jgi:hypothetical protein
MSDRTSDVVRVGAAEAMRPDYNIHLNFLPVGEDIFNITSYRRLCTSPTEQRPELNASAYKLPAESVDETAWQRFWVLPGPAEGFEKFKFQSTWNLDLTRRVLFQGLKKSVESRLNPSEYRIWEGGFIQEVSFIMHTRPEGEELLVVQPYSLKALRQTGFLVDFHFKLNKNVPFSRKIQQFSLSLDKNLKRNLDYYLDRLAKIRGFLEKRWPIFESIDIPGASEPLPISKEFVTLPAERLRSKVYVFSGEKESRSQFVGLREFGPLRPLEGPPTLLFIFREQDRQAARLLATSLKGMKQRGQFNYPGFKMLFKSDLEISANPIVLPDLSSRSMEAALDRARSEFKTTQRLLPVLVLPNSDENGYFAHKAYFSHAGLPTQVCTLRILEDPETLKWAIANLALQIFCKAGGQPWKVRPTSERSLIIGISQSHKVRVVDEQRRIEKYFAFSVLSDSSGLFRQIQVLGESSDHSTYLGELRSNLARVLRENIDSFRRVVIHTSFKLKYDEIRAIQGTTQEMAGTTNRSRCRFAVIKVNHNNRFFGINRTVNSLVPYEATKIRLGPQEYLVWFEGIYPDRPIVTKAFPGPTHLQFLPVEKERIEPAEERELLQDLVNLSGANWRGFNAKSAPVSVFYCHLVAELVQDFNERNLPLPEVSEIRPWFL